MDSNVTWPHYGVPPRYRNHDQKGGGQAGVEFGVRGKLTWRGMGKNSWRLGWPPGGNLRESRGVEKKHYD